MNTDFVKAEVFNDILIIQSRYEEKGSSRNNCLKKKMSKDKKCDLQQNLTQQW